MVLPLILLTSICSVNAATFKVDSLGKRDITIKVPDTRVTKIMKTYSNPAVLIIDVASVEVVAVKKKFVIQYNSGGSADPTFIIKWNDGKIEQSFSIEGTNLDFLENGTLLISGHTNNKFSQHRKVLFNNSKFEEVKQPFWAVGIHTVALANLIARLSPDEKSQPVFNLKKDEKVEVLLSDINQDYFLLKNNEGILGWVLVPLEQRPTVLKDILFAGD